MKAILYTMMLAAFLNPFASSSLTMSFPDMMQEFEATTNDVAWVVEAFLLACTVSIIPGGKLADRYGKRKMFYIGSFTFTGISALMCWVDSIWLLTFYRALQGIALGIVFTTSMSILTLAVPQDKRGYAFGMIGGMVYLGLSLGPALGGLLNYYYGWRSIFVFTFLLGVVANYMAWKYVREEWIESPAGRIPIGSTALYIGSVGAIILGITEWSRWSYSPYLLLGGLCLGAWLVYREWEHTDPLIPFAMFTENVRFTASSVAAMLNFSATFGIGFLLSMYLQLVMGFDSRMTGLMMCIQTGIMVVLGPRMGGLSDRKNPLYLSRLGMVISALGLGSMSYAVQVEILWLMMLSLACIGVGFSTFSAPNNNTIMSSVPKAYVGFASSTIASVRLLGQTLSMALIGIIMSQGIPDVDEMALLKDAITLGFLVFAAICCMGAWPAGMKKSV